MDVDPALFPKTSFSDRYQTQEALKQGNLSNFFVSVFKQIVANLRV